MSASALIQTKVWRSQTFKDSILGYRRLILRSNWTPTRFQESYQCVDLLRFERAAERRHIIPAVDDADDNIISRQFVSNVGKIGGEPEKNQQGNQTEEHVQRE